MENTNSSANATLRVDSWLVEMSLPTMMELRQLFCAYVYGDDEKAMISLIQAKQTLIDEEAYTALATFQSLERKYEEVIPVLEIEEAL